MIVNRKWICRIKGTSVSREGWYLFGLVPLYIRDVTPRVLCH